MTIQKISALLLVSSLIFKPASLTYVIVFHFNDCLSDITLQDSVSLKQGHGLGQRTPHGGLNDHPFKPPLKPALGDSEFISCEWVAL